MSTRGVGDYRLTAKQAEAAGLVGEGVPIAQIARMLGVSPSVITKRLNKARLLMEGQRAVNERRRAR